MIEEMGEKIAVSTHLPLLSPLHYLSLSPFALLSGDIYMWKDDSCTSNSVVN